MNIILVIILSVLASFAATNLVFPKIIKVAKTKNLVDKPNARKLQKRPVPMLGGLAVFFGLLFGLMVASALWRFVVDQEGVRLLSFQGILPVVVGAGIMLYLGALDDILGLSAKARMAIEVFVVLALLLGTGMCVDSLHGLWGVEKFSWWIGVPLTVFACVGIINAYNMVDGVNGLSSGLCIVTCASLGIFFFKWELPVNATLVLCYGAALIPFFLHNVFGKRSRMFIGDSGTMVMGFIVSWCLIRTMTSSSLKQPDHLDPAAMMLAIASVPVMDTLRVMGGRLLRGKSPFEADKTHLHHVFISLGISHSITSLSEIVINTLTVVVWYLVYVLGGSHEFQLYITIATAVIFVWGTYFFLIYQEKHDTKFLAKLKRFAFKTHLGHTHWWLRFQGFLDKGSYEDYAILLGKDPDRLTPEDKDFIAVMNFLQGKKNVLVSDIVDEAGLTVTEDEDITTVRERVLSILDTLEAARALHVGKRDSDSVPEVVTLHELVEA